MIALPSESTWILGLVLSLGLVASSACGSARPRPDDPPASASGGQAGCPPAAGSLWQRVGAILAAPTMEIVVAARPPIDVERAAEVLGRRLRDSGVKVDRVELEDRRIVLTVRGQDVREERLERLLGAGHFGVHGVADAALDELLVAESGRLDGQESISVVRMDRQSNLMSQDRPSLDRFLEGTKVEPRLWGVQGSGLHDAATWHALLLEPASLGERQVEVCSVSLEPGSWMSGPSLALELTEEGTTAFEVLTTESEGARIALVFDGVVVTAPVVQEPITTGQLSILQGEGVEDVRSLAILMRSGALEGPLRLVSVREVAPVVQDAPEDVEAVEPHTSPKDAQP